MKVSDMKKGQTIKVDDKLYQIVDYQHVKLGKGGAVYQTKIKSLADGSIQNIRLRSEETNKIFICNHRCFIENQ